MKTTLSAVTSKIGSGATPRGGRSAYVDEGIAFVRSQNILDLSFSREGLALIDDEQAEALKNVSVQLGDVLINITGDSVARATLWDSDVPARVSQHVAIVRPIAELLDARFLQYLLVNPIMKSELLTMAASGGSRPALTKGMLESLQVELPSLCAQHAIAKVLGALDDKIAANRKVCASLRGLQGSIWSRASRSLPHIPLIELAPPRLGGTPARSSPELWGGGTPWASVRDMTGADLGVILSTAETITIKAAQPERLRPVPAGSVFLTARGTVGEVAVAGVDCACNQSAYAFIPQAGKSAALRLALEGAVAGLISRAHGSVFSTITTSTLADVEVPNFYDGSARRAVSELEVLEERVVTGLKENVSLARTRDELLPLLMSGKVGVKDAERAAEDVL